MTKFGNVILHKDVEFMECIKCNQKFDKNKNLANHWAKYHPNEQQNKIICVFCGQDFDKSINLANHLKKSHPNYKALKATYGPEIIDKCNKCQKTFADSLDLEKHLQTCQQLQEVSSIQEESEERKEEQEKNEAQEENSSEKQEEKGKQSDFQCSICGIQYAYNWNLKKHMKQVHHKDEITIQSKTALSSENKSPQEFPCETCGNNFQNETKLKIHQKIAHSQKEEDKLKCNECNQIFKEQNLLEQHVEKEHNEKKEFKHVYKYGKVFEITKLENEEKKIREIYECKECSQEFAESKKLDNHFTTQHTKAQPNDITCHNCSQTFQQMSELLSHLQKCKQAEKETSDSKNDRNISESSDKKSEGPAEVVSETLKGKEKQSNQISCSLCGFKVVNLQFLNIHNRIAHGNENVSPKPIQQNEQTESEELIQCELCPKSFSNKVNYGIHKSVIHKVQLINF